MIKFCTNNEEMFDCKRFVTRNAEGRLFIFKYTRMSNSSVSNSKAGDFRLFFSAVIRECTFAVKIWFKFVQFILSCFSQTD